MPKLDDLTGRRFGRLTVVERDCLYAGKSTNWICRCDCGNYISAYAGNLKRGRSKSCGCYKQDTAGTHKMYKTRLYNIWGDMKGRCYRKSDRHYERYGGRGISVCDEWLHDFQAFHDWSIANGYAENLTIDRINVDGNYCPENCRWITQAEQLNNTSRNVWLTYCGETYNLTQWGEITGYGKQTIRERIAKHGWSVEDALSIPVGTYNNFKKRIKNTNPS